MLPAPHSDQVLRAITDDDNFRVITASTTQTVRGALATQGVTGETAGHFADMLTGAVLIRETMSPAHRVQAVLKGAGGRGSIVADSHPDGLTRGLVHLPDGTHSLTIGDGSRLQIMRNMARGRMHRSVVEPRPGSQPSEALMTYMQESAQIVSVIAVAATWDADELQHVGGYVVQLLPDADRGPLMLMTERLEAMPPMAEILANLDGNPARLLEELLYGMPYAQLGDSAVSFGCRCDQQAVLASLASLSRDDIAEILREQEVVELSCDYCKTDYRLRRAQLQGLLASS